jgi:hypothetical protein
MLTQSAMTRTILLVVLLSPLFFILRSMRQSKENQTLIPDYFSKSAFGIERYHAYQEPYRSYPCLPRRIHLSQANNVQQDGRVSMTVSFTLDKENCARAKPVVIYGRGFTPEGEQKAEEKLSFDYSSPTTGENFTSDWIYHVQLPGLTAGFENYWYRIQVDQDNHSPLIPLSSSLRLFFLRSANVRIGETPTYNFRTPPLPGSPTTLALVGDIGQTENSTKTMNHILRATTTFMPGNHPVSAILIAGDLSYADGDPFRWESFLELMVSNGDERAD